MWHIATTLAFAHHAVSLPHSPYYYYLTPVRTFAVPFVQKSAEFKGARKSRSAIYMALNEDTAADSFISENNGSDTDTADNIEATASTLLNAEVKKKFNMGTSIGAQNVGEMLFNEELLKSGRGDVRIGSTKRWKNFRGSEFIDVDTND
mmetsp:Transcript_25080/g.52765  ORF Transcript_25080/g.52765 Transcript_25080/m.52765 type:complete len:149 (+) Transcript_25080:296-742(+)